MTDTQKKAAVFDFDGTLIRGDSIVRFLRFAAARGALPRRELFIIALCALGGKMGLVPMEKVKERALRFERGLTRAEKEKLCLGFAERVLVPGLLPEGKKTWENLRREGCVMALASASTSDYLEPLSRALGADRLICTRVAEDGRVSKNCRGEEKARRVAE